MDKELIEKRFQRSWNSYDGQAKAQLRIAERLCDLIAGYVDRRHGAVLEVGCGSGLFSRLYQERFAPEIYWLNDLCADSEGRLQDLLDGKGRFFIAGDAEKTSFPSGLDLLLSCSALQWFDDPSGFVCRCSSLLNRQGYWAFSTFGPENLREVACLTGRSLPYRSLKSWLAAMNTRYEILWSEETYIELSFPDPLQVLKHLQATGVNGIGLYRWTKTSLATFCRQYTERFSTPDGVGLTYHPLYVIAKKR